MKNFIPLKNKSISTDIFDNFLVSEKNVYIMDNHRLALWCWFQEINSTEKYNLLHIDAHPDMSNSALEDCKIKKVNIGKMSLSEYQTISQDKFNLPLFRWDNYLRVFTDIYPENNNSESSLSFTHHLGSSEGLCNDLSSMYLLKELEDIFTQKKYINESSWIVNLDLDYFFTSQPQKVLMFSEEFIVKIAQLLKIGLENKLISVLTIAFSPECCGSWQNAERVYNLFKLELGLRFNP